ncbi:Uncharacterised protein [Serratia fonticola]|nr:Uncharacterised protein [Serratia fonticola]CAI1167677.1 Uncharacterised protein [Serratia fonticola]
MTANRYGITLSKKIPMQPSRWTNCLKPQPNASQHFLSWGMKGKLLEHVKFFHIKIIA